MSPFLLFYISLLLATIHSQQNNDNYTRETTIGYGGMVASAHYLATEAGLQILKNGGTAADAAIAVQMALNVVQPMMSGIGGGAFILYYNYSNKSMYAIDGREEAPNNYHGKIFCKNPDCLLNPDCDCLFANQTASYNEKRIGGLTVGVPGTLHALYNLFKYFGSGMEWSDLLQPAKQLSINGFPMYKEMHDTLSSNTSCMRRFEDSYNLYYNTETHNPIDINETFINAPFGELLNTFQTMGANESIEYFYHGLLAQMIVNATNNHFNTWEYNNESVTRPGVMHIDDIYGYRSVFRQVVESDIGEDGEWRMYGMNMPSSGSVTVQYLMNLMYTLMNKNELNNLNGSDILNEEISSVNNIHYMITANNIAFSDRNQYMADPDFIHVPIDGLLDFDYIYNERGNIFNATAVETPIDFGIPPNSENVNTKQTSMVGIEHGTSHFVVVDQWNNIATVTTTIEGVWGSCIVIPKYGFLLNNELTDFDALGTTFNNITVINGPQGGKRTRRTALNIFGLNDQNTMGGKRPRSSMSPSMVLNKHTMEPVLSIGSPGGSTIIGTTFETMFNILVRHYDVQRGIDGGRIWSFNGNDIRLEEKLWRENVNLRQELEAKGYDLSIFSNRSHGTCQAVRFVKTNHCKGIRDFYVLNGGADDSRWSTSNAKAVCMGNGKSSIDSTSDFCIEKSNVCISTLTDTQRISLITIWLICLIFVLCIVINREKIRKWRQKQKNKKMGYFDEKDIKMETEQYIT